MSLFIWFQLVKGGWWEVDEKWQMRGKNFNHGSLQSGCVRSHISCRCSSMVSKYAHLLFMFAGAKVSEVQRGKNTYQENEYVIVYVSIHLYGKIDIWLTSLLLRSVGVSQNEQEVLHMAPSVLMWVDVLLHTFGEFYPRSSRTTRSVTAWNLIGKQRDAPGKFSQTKTTNPKSWKLCRLFFIRNKCWFYFFLSTP